MKKNIPVIPQNGIKFEESAQDEQLMENLIISDPSSKRNSEEISSSSLNANDQNQLSAFDQLMIGVLDPSKIAEKHAIASDSAKKVASRKRRLSKTYPDATLDLHGMTKQQALSQVQNFLFRGSQQQWKYVLIITGKGKHSGEDGPVLKDTIQAWLQKEGRGYVSHSQTAPARWGGRGALWIELL